MFFSNSNNDFQVLFWFFQGQFFSKIQKTVPEDVLLSQLQKYPAKNLKQPRSCPTRRSENGADLHRAHLNKKCHFLDMSRLFPQRKNERHLEPMNSGIPNNPNKGPIVYKICWLRSICILFENNKKFHFPLLFQVRSS